VRTVNGQAYLTDVRPAHGLCFGDVHVNENSREFQRCGYRSTAKWSRLQKEFSKNKFSDEIIRTDLSDLNQRTNNGSGGTSSR
jgi:hypothetical protein